MKKRRKGPKKLQCLNRSMVEDLSHVLIKVADQYPLQYLTERDFYPLVLAYLSGRVPKLKTEVLKEGSKVDFRVGGTNPAVLELAVRPRVIQDAYCTELEVRGHKIGGRQHFASQNVTELEKLSGYPQSQAKFRYLLLIDFQKGDSLDDLESKYNEVADQIGSARLGPITVVYAVRQEVRTFTIRKSKGATKNSPQPLPDLPGLLSSGQPLVNEGHVPTSHSPEA